MTRSQNQKRRSRHAKTDAEFAAKVRERGFCEAALWENDTVVCDGPLECAHIISRRFVRTRHDEMNALCLCRAHHRWYTEHPRFWAIQIEEELPGRWDALREAAGMIRARAITKDLKKCSACQTMKPVEEFWSQSAIKLNPTCKECGHTYRTPDKNRTQWLRRKYGMTVEVYEELLAKGDGGCWICGRRAGKKRLSVDHDHRTGRVRGILCWYCNAGLQRYDDNPVLLRRAADYLDGISTKEWLDTVLR